MAWARGCSKFLQVKYPADDDNLWLIRGSSPVEVQIESRPGGGPPFLMESDLNERRVRTSDPYEAATVVLSWLAAS
jgi:hypothetical protein